MCICVCRVGKENMKTRRCQREVKERNMRGEKGIIMGKREGKLGRMRGQDRKRTVARMDEREIKSGKRGRVGTWQENRRGIWRDGKITGGCGDRMKGVFVSNGTLH